MGLWHEFKQYFKKKRRLVAVFIDETGRIFEKETPYENNNFTIKIGSNLVGMGGTEQTYIVDAECMIYEVKSNLPKLFYYTNNPYPLKLKHTRSKEGVDSIGFKTLLDSKVITDLFSDEASDKLLWILIASITSAVFGLLVTMKVFGFLK